MKDRLLFWTPPAIALGLVIAVFALREDERQRLHDTSPAVRANALRKLPHNADDTPFIEALRDEDGDVRCVAVDRLGYRGHDRKASEQARILIPLLLDERAHVRRQVAFSLRYIGPDALPTLEQALGDPNPRLRSEAARALPDVFSPKADWGWHGEMELMLSMLDTLLTDEVPEVRTSAEHAINRFRR